MNIAKFAISHSAEIHRSALSILAKLARFKTPLYASGNRTPAPEDDANSYYVLKNNTRCVVSGVNFILDAPSAEELKTTLAALALPTEIEVNRL